MLSKATVLTAPEYAMRSDIQRLEQTVERLQNDVERLTEQVTFLESLLEKRAQDAYLTETTAESQL